MKELAREEGFAADKFDSLPDEFHSLTLSRVISDTRYMVAAVRDGVGLEVNLMFEVRLRLTPITGTALLERLNTFFIVNVKRSSGVQRTWWGGESLGAAPASDRTGRKCQPFQTPRMH